MSERIAKSEEALRETRDYLENLLDYANAPIIVWDPQSRITRFNHAFERLTGKNAGEVLGAPLDILFPDDRREETMAHIQRTVAGERWEGVEIPILRTDGTTRIVLWNSATLYATDGTTVIATIAQGQDITARKRAEKEIRRAAAYTRSLIEVSLDPLVTISSDGRITDVNRVTENVTGRTRDELIGSSFSGYFTEPAKAKAGYEQVFEKGTVRDYPLDIRHRNGNVTPVLYNASVYKDESGKVIGAFAAARDITERKRAEEQLQRYTAELEQANEEIKQFAYIVSHDLRAPLVNLKGFAAELGLALEVIGLVVNAALPHLDEKQRQAAALALQEDIPEALGFIDSSATRMDRFIQALLKLSRLGRRELDLEPIDVRALVQATLQTLAHQIEGRQVNVTVGRLPEIVADRTSMEQIVGNLLNNAIIYLDPDRPGEIEVTAESSPDETTFHIRDNGRGIAEADMDKVFAPFRRAGRQDVPGEGMGLPYVQALVRRHGGRIWVESQPRKGSSFYFTIPRTS